jgi:hypothetical protein
MRLRLAAPLVTALALVGAPTAAADKPAKIPIVGSFEHHGSIENLCTTLA